MNWVSLVLLVIGIGGPLVSALFAIIGSVRLRREMDSRIRIIPSDSIIDSPSHIEVKSF